MKLIELVVTQETVLDNDIEPIQSLLESRVNKMIPSNVFDVMEVLVTEALNSVGNYVVFFRVTLEHPGELTSTEVEDYGNKSLEELVTLTKILLASKKNVISLRSSKVKLL